MNYYTKIVFGIDPTLHPEIYIGMRLHEKEIHGKVLIEFDTGEKYIFTEKDALFVYIETINIPISATAITIKSNSNITQLDCNILRYNEFSSYSIHKNPAIVSIEHFESNTITDLSHAFHQFVNLREFKHFNVTSKVTKAKYMCSEWKSFNGTIPEKICSIFKHLTNTEGMFHEWYSFNQPLPEGFFINAINLKCANFMFRNWFSYNQPLPEGFFDNIGNLKYAHFMFVNWNSYEHDLPEYLVENFNKLNEKNNYVFCGWHKNNQVSNDFKYKDIFIKDYKEEDIFYLKENYFVEIQNRILMSKLKNDTKRFCIKERDLEFVIHKGIFIFPIDLLIENIDINVKNNFIFENKNININKIARHEYSIIFNSLEYKDVVYL